MQQASNSAFSIKRLNPFNGLLQVYQLNSARALSADGKVWEIQVLSDSPQGLWANTPFSGQQYYTFGRWSSEQGLEQVPVNPLFNIRQMISDAEALVEQLSDACGDLPFPPGDPYELWLLDAESHQPIALLASCREEAQRNEIHKERWIAAEPDEHNPQAQTSALENIVMQRADQQRLSQWFLRNEDASASSCDNPAQSRPSADFPELLVTEAWKDDNERELIQDYINSKAPQLLMLPNISDETRERLEKIAIKQAEAVDRLWRLYPQIHNHNLLKSARVEAKIRSANRN
jgi:hypothetical protein